MINELNKCSCYGCGSCKLICPCGAITMTIDCEGFKYPVISKELCTGCNICDTICPAMSKYQITPYPQEIYAVRHRNPQELMVSRSGGVFTALVDYTLSKSGVIYGAGYDSLKVVHKRVEDKEGCLDLKGSKYVQSDLSDIFIEVKKDLIANRLVLFSGTPCQVDGLSRYLQKTDTQKLILCDLICHGVPSPLVWSSYIDYIERKYKDTVINTNFRDKSFGWSSHYETFQLRASGGKIATDYFKELFYRHLILRPSCETCQYSNFNRCSDITLGDFWGWEKSLPPEFNSDNKGVSLIFINSNKGHQVFDTVKNHLFFIESSKKDCLQPQLSSPPKVNPKRDRFWKDFHRYGIFFVILKYVVIDKGYIKNRFFRIIKRIFSK